MGNDWISGDQKTPHPKILIKYHICLLTQVKRVIGIVSLKIKTLKNGQP
jgi:hypothetical protein